MQRASPLKLKTRKPVQSLAAGDQPPAIVTGAETSDAAEALCRGLKTAIGVNCPIVSDAAFVHAREKTARAIAVGNMANNALVRECYLRYQCLTDRAYPGPGGWELRTIDAGNLLLCGASDRAGAMLAVNRLQELAKSSKGEMASIIDVKLGAGWEQTLKDIAAFEATAPPKEIRFGISDADEIDKSGTYYYLTGRLALGSRYRDAWLRMAAAHPERVREEQIHLRMCWRVLAWDLLADTGVFSDADRESIGRYLAEVLDGPEGLTNAGLGVRSGFAEPRQNHETHVALALIYGARCIRRLFEGERDAEWERAGRKLFEVYDRHWKPVEDTYDHGMALTMVDVLDACLCFPDVPFVSNGGLRKATELAMSGCGNNGLVPIIGDSDGNWPGELLAAAGSLYRDGRFVWMAQRGKAFQDYNTRLQRRWADDVAPTPPDDLIGLSVQPLDKLYYDLPNVDLPYAKSFYVAPPNVPHERTFDKLTLRAGLEPSDAYVLMDGVAGGSHSYDDTNAIHAFDALGKSWIVPEDNLHWPQQTQHSLVTIVRDGTSERIPTFADLRHAKGLRGGSAFVVSQVNDFAGADWRRGLVWASGSYLLVLDEVEARQPGNYTIEARFRTLGEHSFAGDMFTLAQGDARFHISWDGVDHAWGEPVDVSIAYLWDPRLVEDRRRRYGGIWPLVLTMLHLSVGQDLSAGERTTIASVMHPSANANDKPWTVRRLGRMGARLQRGDEIEYAGLAPDGVFQSAGIELAGAAFRIGSTVLALSDASRLTLAGRAIISASEPIDLELDRAKGIARLTVKQSARVELATSVAATAAGVKLDGRELVPAGQHDISGVDWEKLDLLRGLAEPPAKAVAARVPIARAARVSRIDSVTRPTCFALLRHEQIAVGGATGEIATIDPQRGVIWRSSIPGEILTIAGLNVDGERGGDDGVVAGGTGCAIHAFDNKGKPMWVVRPEFGSQFWIWWTLNESQIHKLLVDDLDGDGAPEILAGVSNMRLHCYDAAGREKWKFRTDHGVFKTFVTADLDGDGKPEIVGGTDFLSATSIVRVIGADGVQRRAFVNQGWTSQVRSLLVADIDGDGKLEVCCGTNREDCLRVHHADGSGLRWSHNLGDTVTGIVAVQRGDERLLVAGSRSFYVSAFDAATGRPRWVTNVGHAVTSMIAHDNHMIIGTHDGRVLALDFAGKIQSETTLAGAIVQLGILGKDILALGDREAFWRISLNA